MGGRIVHTGPTSRSPRSRGRAVAAEYATGRGPFQERAHLVALSFAFLWDCAEFVRRWASWA